MKKVATTREMQKIDSLAISSYGIEGLELMESAGIGIAKALKKRFCDFFKKRSTYFLWKGEQRRRWPCCSSPTLQHEN